MIAAWATKTKTEDQNPTICCIQATNLKSKDTEKLILKKDEAGRGGSCP